MSNTNVRVGYAGLGEIGFSMAQRILAACFVEQNKCVTNASIKVSINLCGRGSKSAVFG